MDKKLLQRYIEGNVSTEEIESVVNWLDKSEENVREYMALHKLYDISILNKQAYNQPTRSSKKRIFPFRTIIYESLKIAAIFLIVWIGIKKYTDKPEQPLQPIAYQTLYVPAGQRAQLTLSDSTTVWLNAKSKLIYPTNFEKDKRIVKLEGEAYFDVTHSDKQPFIVKTDKMDIEVLGTSFNVTDYADYNMHEVSLLKGSIKLKTSSLPQGYIVKVDECVKIDEGKIKVSTIKNHDHFKWKEGLLCFDNETVESIIQKLQLYFDVRINIAKSTKLLKLRYTGKFRVDDGVEQVLKVLQLEHGFSYTRDNEQNLITIK